MLCNPREPLTRVEREIARELLDLRVRIRKIARRGSRKRVEEFFDVPPRDAAVSAEKLLSLEDKPRPEKCGGEHNDCDGRKDSDEGGSTLPSACCAHERQVEGGQYHRKNDAKKKRDDERFEYKKSERERTKQHAKEENALMKCRHRKCRGAVWKTVPQAGGNVKRPSPQGAGGASSPYAIDSSAPPSAGAPGGGPAGLGSGIVVSSFMVVLN